MKLRMMIVLGVAAACSVAWSQELKIPEVQFPKLPSVGRDAAAFAPAGWKVETQVAGDLNTDGKADLAFVLHQASARNVLANKDNLGAPSIDTNPRILCVALANAAEPGYTLVLQNHTLIPRWTEPTQDDNFGEDGGAIKIARRALQVSLHYFANAGGWDTGSTTLTFRLQNKHFELIGYENDNHARNTGVDTMTSANYSTGQVLIDRGSDTGATRHKRKVLPKRALLTMEQVGDGMAFAGPE